MMRDVAAPAALERLSAAPEQETRASPPEQQDPSPCHLVVLQHGLWGAAHHLETLQALVLEHTQALGEDSKCVVRVLNSNVNSIKKTYDGIDVCGDRLVALIKDTAELLEKEQQLVVTKLSFVGYSLGGLIARYAVGRMEQEGIFVSPDAPSTSGRFEAVNFTTIATPHLGAWRAPPKSWLRRAYNRVYHAVVPVTTSLTGAQLMLEDVHAAERPLLINLAHPSLAFVRGLKRFRKLIMLANTHSDQMVPYRTAAASATDPYDGTGADAEPAIDALTYPSVVRPKPGPRMSTVPWFLMPLALLLLPLLLPLIVLAMLAMFAQGFWHAWFHVKPRDHSHWLEGITETTAALTRRLSGHVSARAQAQASGDGRGRGGVPGEGKGRVSGDGRGRVLSNGALASSGTAAPAAAAAVTSAGAAGPEAGHVAGGGSGKVADDLQLLGVGPGVGGVNSPSTTDLGMSDGGELEADGVASDIILEEKKRVYRVPDASPPSTDAPMSDKQAYMIEHLNELPWQKVDVDLRHPHAHAAIILRPRASSQVFPSLRWSRKDHLKFMFDQMQWP